MKKSTKTILIVIGAVAALAGIVIAVAAIKRSKDCSDEIGYISRESAY